MPVTLLADSGATKAEWCLLKNGKKKTYFTQGISPYFLSTEAITELVQNELAKKLKGEPVEHIHYYGAGCANPENAKSVKKALKRVFPQAAIHVNTDLMAAARAIFGEEHGKAGEISIG